jgi:RNA polymerase sigma-70 factor (ECF subfamily)
LNEQPGGHASHDADARERAAALWDAIDALPDKFRIVVVLANMEGHSLADVGALLGVPEGTIKWRLSEARRQLKEQLSWMHTDRTR